MTHFIKSAHAPTAAGARVRPREHAFAHPAMKARREPAVKNAFRHARARDDERPFWGLRHRPQRAPMAWPNRRCAHCHLPPRALPDAQPQQHGAQCAEQHDKQLGAPPTFLITKHQSCAPRGRVRRTNASRFAHAFSRLRIAPCHPTCSSFCSTRRSPACAACCTASCMRRAREPSRGPRQ